MMPGQRIYKLLKEAKGEHVPVSHIAAIVKFHLEDVIQILEKDGVQKNKSTISERLRAMAYKGDIEQAETNSGYLYAKKGTPSIQDDIYKIRIIKVMQDGYRKTVDGLFQKTGLKKEIIQRILDDLDVEVGKNKYGETTYRLMDYVEMPDIPLFSKRWNKEEPLRLYQRQKRIEEMKESDWLKVNALFVEIAKRGFDRNPYEWMR